MRIRGLLVVGLASLVMSCSAETPAGAVKPAKNQITASKILESTKKNQVVMFGEAHGTYRADNDFVIELLPELKKQGYRYLALELSSDVSKLPEYLDYIKSLILCIDGKVERSEIHPGHLFLIYRQAAGWIELAEKARSLEFEVVRYDDVIQNIGDVIRFPSINNVREKESFGKLKEIIFDKDSDAKVIVYCGAFHVNEKPDIFGMEEVTWLGKYLRDYTGGKVYTVSFGWNVGYPQAFCDLEVKLED